MKLQLDKYYIPALLGLTLPFSIILSNYLFAIVMILLIYQSPRRTEIAWLPMTFMAIPLFIPLISIFFHGETFNWSQLEVRIPFLATALVVGICSINFKLLTGFKRGLILGTLIATAIFLLDNSILEGHIQKLTFIDLSYIPLFLVVSLIMLWFSDIKFGHYIKLISSIIFLLALFMYASAFFIVSGLLISFSAIIAKGSTIQSKIAIFLIVVVSAFMLYRGNEINDYLIEQNRSKVNPTEKLAQWQCVLEIMQDKELFGIGFANKENALLSCYHDHDMNNAEALLLNAHNEYLDFFLTLGYIGVLALLIYFINALFVAYDYKQVAHLQIMILIALFSLTENVFTRQKGVMLTSITYLLIYSAKDFSRNKEDSEVTNSDSQK
jgi:O-antigen ligase